MKMSKKLLVGIFLAVFPVVYTHSAALGAGIPAAILMPADQTLVLINFNSQYTSGEVDSLITQVQGLVESLLSGTGINIGTPAVLTPDQLTAYGDADAINSLLQQPGLLSSLGMSVYIRIDATKVQGPGGLAYRLDIYLYNGTPGSFMYVLGLEVPSYLTSLF